MLSRFWLHELTRPVFEAWLEHEPDPVIIIGLGSLEQHGPHLPLGTDSLTIREYIHAVAQRTNSVCVHPCLVEMERLEGWEPTLKLHPTLVGFLDPEREDYALARQVFRACTEPDTHHFTSSGIYGNNDPRDADIEEATARFEEKVNFVADFIRMWKTVPIPPAFRNRL